MARFALLAFHFASEDLRAWRLALRLDPDFAALCLERVQMLAGLQERYPDLLELRLPSVTSGIGECESSKYPEALWTAK